MKLSEEFVVLDTETTGPNPDVDRIVQIGWSRFTGGRAVDTGSALVDPGPGVEIARGAYEVHGIGRSDVDGQPGFPAVFAARSWQPVVVTYNGLYFDVPILRREAGLAGFDPALPAHVDVYVFCAWHFRGLKSRKLSALANYFGIKIHGALHTADVDCELTGRLLTHLVAAGVVPDDVAEAVARQEVLGQALAWESRRWAYWFYEDRVDGRLRMGCGRHIGKLVADVPKRDWVRLRDKVADAPAEVMNMFKELGK